MKAGHTSVRQGKRVLVLMRDGSMFTAKFKDKKSTRISFYDAPDVLTSQIRTLQIPK